MPRKPVRNPARSKERILHAATREFAARGFGAAGVDRIARRAGVNKALIYYYFDSKLALYRTVLRQEMAGLAASLREALEGAGSAVDRLDRYIAALVSHVTSRPDLTSLMLRELADSGRHLDADMLRGMVALPAMLFAALSEGRGPRLSDREILMLHFTLVGTTLLLASNTPIRARVRQMGLAQPPTDARDIAAQLQAFARRALRKDV